MEQHSTALYNGVLSGLGLHQAKTGGIQDFLLRASYIPSASNDSPALILSQVSSEKFVESLTYDFERFALSSRESYLVALSEQTAFGSLGWPMLKLYYASFFAAHAIMRSRGAGIIKLDRKHVDHLNSVSQIYDPDLNSLSPGMHLFYIQEVSSNAGRGLSILIKPDQKSGGVHESFWSNFCNFIDMEAQKSVTRGDVESANFVALSADLRNAIKNGRATNSVWLSSIRNEINYQHKYDSWLPYKRASESYKAFGRLNGNLKLGHLNDDKDNQPINAFLNITCYISNMAFDVFELVASRSKKGGTFGQKWTRLNNLASSRSGDITSGTSDQ